MAIEASSCRHRLPVFGVRLECVQSIKSDEVEEGRNQYDAVWHLGLTGMETTKIYYYESARVSEADSSPD